MRKLKAVIFDYGNVLCLPQEEADLEAMSFVLQVAPESFRQAYWRHRIRYDKHELDSQKYWSLVAADCQKEIGEMEMSSLTRIDSQSWSRPNQIMVDWAKRLRSHGLTIALLSNMPLSLKEHVQSRCSWLPEFHKEVYSCDLLCTKPEARIYEHCLQELAVQADDALFIDDRQENIEAALAVGINALTFSHHEALYQSMRGKFALPPITDSWS